MKLIMATIQLGTKCKLCEKIETKSRRWQAEVDRVSRWERDGGRFRASIEKSNETIRCLVQEIYDLNNERQRRLQSVGSGY